jgi:hypothetical protein
MTERRQPYLLTPRAADHLRDHQGGDAPRLGIGCIGRVGAAETRGVLVAIGEILDEMQVTDRGPGRAAGVTWESVALTLEVQSAGEATGACPKLFST